MARLRTVDADRLRAHKEHAAQLVAKGRVDQAVSEYKAALEIAPADVVARQRVAELLARMGKNVQAIEQYLCLVGKYATEGYLLKAIATCHLILQLDPSHAATQSILSDLYAERDAKRPPVRIPSSMCPALDELASAPPMIDPSTLARIPLFSDLPPDAFVSLVHELSRRDVRAGDTIVQEGAPGDAMYAVAHGVVRVERRAAQGEPRVLAELGEGEFFGEMSLLARCPRLATVSAVTDCALLELGRRGLESLVARHPKVLDVVTKFHRERLMANVLRASAVLRKLPPERRQWAAELFRIESHPSGTLLLRQGQPPVAFFLLLRGECDVVHTKKDGTEEHYLPMREGDVFGEVSLLQDGPVTASVRTLTPCVVLSLPREWFDALLLADPPIRDALYKLASKRLERTGDMLLKEMLEERLV